MAKTNWLAGVKPVAEKLAAQMGLELVEIEMAREASGRFLRFYIDKAEGVSIQDCEKFHRAIHPKMEHVDYDYMEVSSPGADRPLTTPRDFERAQGLAVEVHTYGPVHGAKRHIGDLIGLRGEDQIVILSGQGELVFEKKQVSQVKPYLDFTEEDLQDEYEAPEGEPGECGGKGAEPI